MPKAARVPVSIRGCATASSEKFGSGRFVAVALFSGIGLDILGCLHHGRAGRMVLTPFGGIRD
jgi:hypothetical protein